MPDIDVAFTESSSWEEDAMLARLAWLRKNSPVHWSEADGLWLLSRYEDVVYASKHQELFTSGQGVRGNTAVKIGLIDEEEPRHGQLRALINRGFTPRMVKKLEETFLRLTTRAIDAVSDRDECDFVESISVPLPLRLIASMIGIAEEDYERFHRWSDDMIAADGNYDDPEITARAGKAFVEYATYVTAIIEDRRRKPQDDLVSILTGAKDDGMLQLFEDRELRGFEHVDDAHSALANDELIKLLVILMVAGNETTRNGISGGMALLIENPEQRDRLTRKPALIKPAVEEMLRLVSPVRSFTRTVVEDTELRGQPLKAGERVMLLYPSANRDETVFPDAERFDIERNPNHVAFGVGSHFCLGANLARMEMRVAFEHVLRRMPEMEYAGRGPVLRPSALVRTCSEMRVRYKPERRAAA